MTATTAELNHVDGVTSNVQTQMDTKSPVASPTFTGTVTGPTINASTALQIGGVAITATAAELNKMDGVTVSASDINSVTTKAASLSDLSVTATAAELNYNDITTLGTVEASKVVTADANGDVLFPDNEKLKFGTGSDLSVYHDSNHSILEETGTGALKLKGDDIRLEDASGNNIVKAVGSGSAELYEAGTKKLETTSDGVDITGNIVRITGTSPMTHFMESGVTDSNHRIRQNSGNLVFQKLSDDEGTATDRMLIDGGTGNVGIGTTSPDALLHVAGRSKIQTVIEDGHVDTGTSGTTNIDFANTVAVYYFVNSQVGNAQLNFRGSGSQTLNALLSVGDAATATVAYTQGGTAKYVEQVQIDGSNVTPKWAGGTAPTAGNASGIDVYSFSIIKTADATFTVFASLTQYA